MLQYGMTSNAAACQSIWHYPGGPQALFGAGIGQDIGYGWIYLGWVYFGDTIDAQEAHRIGLANRVVPDDRVVSDAVAWAEQLCDAAPIALPRLTARPSRSST